MLRMHKTHPTFIWRNKLCAGDSTRRRSQQTAESTGKALGEEVEDRFTLAIFGQIEGSLLNGVGQDQPCIGDFHGQMMTAWST